MDQCTELIPSPDPDHGPKGYTEITVTAYLRMLPDGTLELVEFNPEDTLNVEHYGKEDGYLHDVYLNQEDNDKLVNLVGDLEAKLIAAQKSS
jgi:hypothetical protein